MRQRVFDIGTCDDVGGEEGCRDTEWGESGHLPLQVYVRPPMTAPIPSTRKTFTEAEI